MSPTAPRGARAIDQDRVYEDPGRRRGEHRALVDRLLPRGVYRDDLDHDEWAKDVAPSTELRRWYSHDPERFSEFSRRYIAELDEDPAAGEVARLRDLAAGKTLVLLTATRDIERSGAVVLRTKLNGAQPANRPVTKRSTRM